MKDFKNKRVLITGGGGFIGSHLTNYLLEQGLKVRIFDLWEQILGNLPSKKTEVISGSILDSNRLARAMRGCEYVVHLAAMLGVKKTEMLRLETLDINILGTVNVLEACVKERIKKIVFTSSSEVYGDQKKVPIFEDNPLFPKSVYAVSKLTGEEYVKAYKKRYGLDYTIVRLFNVYGLRQVAEFVIPRFVKNILNNRPPVIYGKGNQVRSFCHVNDIARGIFLVLIKKEANSEIFNIGSDKNPININQLAKQ